MSNEVYSCVACLFWLVLGDGLKNEGYSLVARLFRLMD